MIEKTKDKEIKEKYIEAIGRRKTSIARVRLIKAGRTSFIINQDNLEKYFPTEELRIKVKEAIEKSGIPEKFKISALIKGGGLNSQAEALRHGIARALVLHTPLSRKKLKQAGFLKRDPRAKERRKFGLKKARKAPQWSKR
jgi:small subunit ribosomal protein S9